jgi:hypothetical protein
VTGPHPAPTAPTSITLHVSPHVFEVDAHAFATDLAKAAPAIASVAVEGDLLLAANAPGRRLVARRAALALATARVKNPLVPREFVAAAAGEEDFEMRVDADAPPHALATLSGRLYDGERAARAALELVPAAARQVGHVHVWATRRLLVTYSQEDFRYHARYAIHGYPSLFSTLALRYAPAPSKESQVERMRLVQQGMSPEIVEQTVSAAYAHESFDAGAPAVVTRALASSALQAAAIAAGMRPSARTPPAACSTRTAAPSLSAPSWRPRCARATARSSDRAPRDLHHTLGAATVP